MKYRIRTSGVHFKIQRKGWFPLWTNHGDDYNGTYFFSTLSEAETELKLIIRSELERDIKIKQNKALITNEELSVADFIKKYPEEFL